MMSNKLKLGFGICGSFCTHAQMLCVMEQLSEKYDIYPVLSEISSSTDTRFGSKEDLKRKIEDLTKKSIITSIKDAEPLGPVTKLDAMLICPCTGNTLAKFAHGITDSAVTMASKATARCGKPVILSLASNDALGANLQNIGLLYNKKNVYFVPVSQDDSVKKPYSLVCDFSKVEETVALALQGEQIQPFLK